ncbi:MAG: PsbP-related protein [Methanobacteriaceae archaeon]|nr:PsbP-related protein [Methanobacteriaceae archaeon]
MKKYLILIALLSAVVLASGCVDNGNQTTNQTSGIATKTYTNDTAGYSFEYPENWQQMPANVTGDAVGFRDESTGTNLIVSTLSTTQPTDEELTTFLTQLESQYGAQFEGFDKVSSNTVTINGVKGIEIIFKSTSSGEQIQQRQVILFKDNVAYFLTFTAKASEYAKESANFDAVVNSFKIQ